MCRWRRGTCEAAWKRSVQLARCEGEIVNLNLLARLILARPTESISQTSVHGQ